MRNRGVIVAGVIILIVMLIVGLGAFVLSSMGDLSLGGEPAEVEVTETEIPTMKIVVAAQDIPRGMRITLDNGALTFVEKNESEVPNGALTSMESLEGKFARADIARGTPMLPGMVTSSGPTLFPQGLVAYAIPMDLQGGVAWAIKEGDHVDVLAAIKLAPVDPDFQSRLPDSFMSIPTGAENEASVTGNFGRFETAPNGMPILIYPTGELLPMLVVQLTVQDAIVWHVGIWQNLDEASINDTSGTVVQPAQITQNTLPIDGTPTGDQLAGAGAFVAQATPEPTALPRGIIEPVTLLVNRQDALVLKYLMEMGADLDLVLRPAGDTEQVLTDPVWLRYVLDRYQIPNTPSDLPVAPVEVQKILIITVVPAATPQE